MHHFSFIIHVEFHLFVPETRPRQPQGKITLKSSKDYIKLVDTGKLPETKCFNLEPKIKILRVIVKGYAPVSNHLLPFLLMTIWPQRRLK